MLVGQVVGRRGVHSVRQVAVLLRMMVEPRLRRAFARRWRAGVAVIYRARWCYHLYGAISGSYLHGTNATRLVYTTQPPRTAHPFA